MEHVVIPVITETQHHIYKRFFKKVLSYLLFYLTLIFSLQAKYSCTTLFNGLRLHWHKIWSQYILPWTSLLWCTSTCWEEREHNLKLESLAPSNSWPHRLLALGLHLCPSFSLGLFPPKLSRARAAWRTSPIALKRIQWDKIWKSIWSWGAIAYSWKRSVCL